MKRFALFASDAYYPQGGAYDFRTWVESVEQAEAFLSDPANFKGPLSADWAHVWDTDTGEIVASYEIIGERYDRSGAGKHRPREVRKL